MLWAYLTLGALWMGGAFSLTAAGERRLQLKWLLGGSLISLIGAIAGITLSSASGFRGLIGGLGLVLAAFALPASMGVAILTYRLYDIDRVIGPWPRSRPG